ncbi:hypothetical protein LTR70_004579 [Exophiala xenobiotica]|uniref:SCP domain-containing protein n=1 Tax=Lithohypha guttulata TaxID=1690604 RepID=A0ABR0KCW1_9EURO|nr:hypothetical protein LTR24_004164 [Lithohypha guttulata]KAK5320353.1 hypothetical protein LTR70_004579 [Exophiala xenobiotica]
MLTHTAISISLLSLTLQLLLPTHTLASPQDTDTTTNTITAPTATTIASTKTTYIAAPTTPASPQYTDPLTLRTSLLNSTNLYRYQHNASYIPWNDTLAAYAATYSAQCIWAHSYGPQGYGENLARGYTDITSAVDAWGNERALYNFGSPSSSSSSSSSGDSDSDSVTGFTEETGHFTQLVWKDTQSVGCAVFACDGKNGVGGHMLVCEYWPPGNIQGTTAKTKNVYFETNVQRQAREGEDGFDTYSATVGATGVSGTATAGATPTGTSGAARPLCGGGGGVAVGVGMLVVCWSVLVGI